MKQPIDICGSWGPAGNRAALSITFDNLGEAADLEMGTWNDTPIGEHHTASFIPRLLETLGDVRATYFIEASNAAIYPDAIRHWFRSGNEVGLHAWRHENWGRCSADQRRELLERSIKAMQSLDIAPVGFRPPGGDIPLEAWQEFEEAGLRYCSDLGTKIGCVGKVVSIPFAWRAVDVYMIEDVMAFMRTQLGDPEPPFGLSEWKAELDRIVAAALAEGGHRTVIFHPNFLGTSDEKLGALRHLIDTARVQDIWLAPAGDVAAFAAARVPALATH